MRFPRGIRLSFGSLIAHWIADAELPRLPFLCEVSPNRLGDELLGVGDEPAQLGAVGRFVRQCGFADFSS